MIKVKKLKLGYPNVKIKVQVVRMIDTYIYLCFSNNNHHHHYHHLENVLWNPQRGVS